jgi:hypothetical protein
MAFPASSQSRLQSQEPFSWCLLTARMLVQEIETKLLKLSEENLSDDVKLFEVRIYLRLPRPEAIWVNLCLPKLRVSRSDTIDNKLAHLVERYKV